MKDHNGASYSQNYDIIVKWLSDALRGQTLEVIGVKTGRIEEVFGFEPADIAVRAGRTDVMARDDKRQCKIQSVKFKKNIFCILHFELSFSKRLTEIREFFRSGDFGKFNLLELVFLPLCGKETGAARSELAEEVLRFGSELYHSEKLPATLLAAILIMSNKLIDKERLKALWEDIKMLDILEIAEEKGIEKGKLLGINEGKMLGINEGKLLGISEMLIDDLIERFGVIPAHITERIGAVQNPNVLKVLRRQIPKCQNIQEFEAVMNQVL